MDEKKEKTETEKQLIQVIQFYLEQLNERELHMALGFTRGLAQ